ncbi:hypothetical protein F5148DRAFT_1166735 [Russula earlei]|uniref:Uncharacterized protein n=1 Tax=Russula earlei TaxID=71964 RepID=A0ACC0ULA2_9AGAM|nr:hypothetical protein F5148DRAFT_1166735 [Russula earlei]
MTSRRSSLEVPIELCLWYSGHTMASSWLIYTPDSPPTHDLKSLELDAPPTEEASALASPNQRNNPAYTDQSNLKQSLHTTIPTGSVKPDATLVYVDAPIESPSKNIPIVVSATSVRVNFREAGPPTLPLDEFNAATSGAHAYVHNPTITPPSPRSAKARHRRALSTGALPSKRRFQPISTLPLAPHSLASEFSPYDADPPMQRTHTSERDEIAATSLTRSTTSLREQAAGPHFSSLPSVGNPAARTVNFGEHVLADPESGLMPQRHVLPPAPTANSQGVTPISAADNMTPLPTPLVSTDPNRITSTDINNPSSPTFRAPHSPTFELTQSPVLGRERSERQTPKRSVTGGTFGSGSVVQPKYAEMVFENVPRLHHLLAWLFTWMLLAGFVVLPSTFSTFERVPASSGGFEEVQNVIRNLPVLIVAYACCGIGVIGMCLLWFRWSHNYVWLLNSIFVPGLLNGLSGLLSTFAGIYGMQDRKWGATSIITLAVTGGCALVCGTLTAIYSLWKLDRVKRPHSCEMEQARNGDCEIGEKRLF